MDMPGADAEQDDGRRYSGVPFDEGTEFLEASELGDSDSLRLHLGSLREEERRTFVKRVDQHSCSGLLLSAKRGDQGLVDVLLDAHANPNDADSSGVAALHYAAGRGSRGVVESLLRCKAVVDVRDDRGDTPLLWARGAAAGLLLESRADANARNAAGTTALIAAARRGELETSELLVCIGADVDALESSGLSAHAAAGQAGHAEVADALTRLGATCVAREPRLVRREEALQEAAVRNDAAVCHALLAGGLAPDVEVGGETALLRAAGAGSFQAADLLLRARADPRRPDSALGETPLMRAAGLGATCDELLWLLLEGRADPTQTDIAGRTAVAIAKAWGREDAEEILKAAVAGELDLEYSEEEVLE